MGQHGRDRPRRVNFHNLKILVAQSGNQQAKRKRASLALRGFAAIELTCAAAR
jgi:hypothetical protein